MLLRICISTTDVFNVMQLPWILVLSKGSGHLRYEFIEIYYIICNPFRTNNDFGSDLLIIPIMYPNILGDSFNPVQ